MGARFRPIASLAVLAALLVPVCSAFLHHDHATVAVASSGPHDARHHLCAWVDRSSGPSDGCPICLAQRSLSQSLVAVGRELDHLAAIGLAPSPTGEPASGVRLRTRAARAPPAC